MNGTSHFPIPDEDDGFIAAELSNNGDRADDDEDYVPTSDKDDADEDEQQQQAARDEDEDDDEEEEEGAERPTRVRKRGRRRGARRRFSSAKARKPGRPRKRRKKDTSSEEEEEEEEEAEEETALQQLDKDGEEGDDEPQANGDEDGAEQDGEAEENGEAEVEDEDGENEVEDEDDEPELVQPVTDSREITISMDKLNKLIACRLCGGYYREATTIIECAHTFCKPCLARHIDLTNEHKDTLCPHPKCPTKLKTADPLRNETKFDRALQNLVDKLLPQFAQADEALRREIQVSAGLRRGTSDVNTSKRRRAEPSVGAALLFELTPHPSSSLPALAKPLIKTQASATVRNIRQLLLQQLRLKVDESELLVYCSDELLAADHSLDFIRRTRWHDPNTHMQIQYKMM